MRRTTFVATSTVVMLVLCLARPVTAHAYSPTAARNWADSHWNTCGVGGNPPKYECLSNDCANFVSQALHEGGYPFHGWPVGNTVADWFSYANPDTGWRTTSTWAYAENLYDFLVQDYPGGFTRPTMNGTSLASDSGVGTGDLLFYDWNPAVPDGGSEPRDHVAIVVKTGFAEQGDAYYGDLVNAHNNYRYHAFWTLRSWNTHLQTTKIYPLYISTSN